MNFLKNYLFRAFTKFWIGLFLLITASLSLTSCGLVGAAANLAAGTVGTAAQLAGAATGTAVQLLPIKMMFSCLPEGTQIDTPDGSQSVESLKAGDKVIGYSGNTVLVKQIHEYDEDEKAAKFMTVEFQDGAKVDLCEMHRIDGIRAKNLLDGDKTSSKHVVKSITRYVGVERSYDMITEDAGYRVGGVPVNSMIEEMFQAAKTGKIKK